MTGPCSGGSGKLNVRSSRKSTASCTCPDGPEMHYSAGSPRRQRSLPRSSSTSWIQLHCAPSTPEPARDLVTVGSLVLVKNHSYLLDVLAETKKSGQVLTLDIFGEGPLRSDLERKISSLGLDDQVRLRGFRSDVRALLPGYRAYVHGSYSEALSFAIVEAMAAGLPVVAGNFGGIPELFDHGVEGRYWPLDDPVRAAAEVMDLLDSEPERLRAARSATQRFHRDFDADIVASRLFHFVMGITPPASKNEAATKPLSS